MVTKIQVLGPFNSGTNLVCKIIISFINKYKLRASYNIKGQGHTLIWKHTILNLLDEIDNINKTVVDTNDANNTDDNDNTDDNNNNDDNNTNNKDKVIFICCYKNPYSWFNSILKESYDIKLQNENIFKKLSLARKKGKYDSPNLLQLWLDYYNNYRIILESNKYNTILFQYHNILHIDNKELIYTHIRNMLANIFISKTENINTNTNTNTNINTNITLEHINDFITKELDNILSKPSKGHGKPFKSNKEAYGNYFKNIDKLKNVVNDYNVKNDNILEETIKKMSELIQWYESK